MARFKSCKQEDQSYRLRSDWNNGELIVSGRGRGAYVWVGPDYRSGVGHGGVRVFSGRETLRRLARTILRATAPQPRRKAR